ncbi:MAG: hypothetical protein IT436_09685 [Phycisphaerales bacterium]|nr:hypothetical protein [Phycisphaerales bacterium]
MKRAHGFTLIDLGVVGSIIIAGGVLAQVPPLHPAGSRSQSFALMQTHAMAVGQYRADNANAFPITLTYRRGIAPGPTSGSLEGWCTWSHAGKNNDGWWASSPAFDVEAADRPLNSYLYPGVTFQAPTPPARLPASDPARAQQAPLNRDPSDRSSHQRLWPAQSKVASTYIDVGTSLQWQAGWWEQFTTGSFEQRFHMGTARLATGQGVTPSRFVWEEDPFSAIVLYSSSPAAQVRNWWRDTNKSIMLFVDGHAGYHTTHPGRRTISFSNPDYTLIFDDLPNPGFP